MLEELGWQTLLDHRDILVMVTESSEGDRKLNNFKQIFNYLTFIKQGIL